MRRNFVSKPTTEIGAPLPSTPGDVFCMPVEAGIDPIGNKAFDAAVQRGGGRFVTIKPTADTYMPVYYTHGKSYPGKVHHDKKHGKKHVGAAESQPIETPLSFEDSSSDDDD